MDMNHIGDADMLSVKSYEEEKTEKQNMGTLSTKQERKPTKQENGIDNALLLLYNDGESLTNSLRLDNCGFL